MVISASTDLTNDRGCGHLLKAQILFCPITSMMTTHYASYDQFGKNNDYSLSSDAVKMSVDRYINDTDELKNKLVTPHVATLEEMKASPPALIITAECDMLRDEAEEYSRKLTEAGVHTTAIRFIGTSKSPTDAYVGAVQLTYKNFLSVHGFVMLSAITPQRETALDLMAHYLRDTFSKL